MPELIPMPDPGESEEHYIIRAHQMLTAQVPDPDERNALIWSTWDHVQGPATAAQIAAKNFGNQRFAHVPSICLFAEHETTDSQGAVRKYDLPAMIRIVRTCNERIVDFDGFSPLTDGHTPNPDDPDQTDPPVVGYAGPYRLGMVGRLKPRWGIFADEWHYRDCAAQLQRKPRRSVELWTFAHDPIHMHFDPIAVLGAETPRLSLPSRYHAQELAGVTVTRYSAPAFASPGGSNTFVRQPVKGTCKVKTQYEKPVGKTPWVEKTPSGPVHVPGSDLLRHGGYQTNHPVGKVVAGMLTPGSGPKLPGGERKFEADESHDPLPNNGGNSMPLSNEDIGQLLSALAETPQFKFIDQLMAEHQGAGPGGEPDGDEFADGAEDDLGDVADMLVDEGEGDGDAGPAGGGEEGPPVAEEDELPEEKNNPAIMAGLQAAKAAAGPMLAKAGPALLNAGKAIAPHALLGASGYMGAKAGSKAAQNSRKASGSLADKYSRVTAAHNKLVQEHGRLADRMRVLEREKTDAERVAALQGLAGRYPEFVDLDGEYKATLYSRGASMNDKAFQAHVATVEKYAHKAAMTARSEARDIPVGELPRRQEDAQAEKYAAKLTREAVRIHTAAVNAGKSGYTYEDAKAEAAKILAARG